MAEVTFKNAVNYTETDCKTFSFSDDVSKEYISWW